MPLPVDYHGVFSPEKICMPVNCAMNYTYDVAVCHKTRTYELKIGNKHTAEV